MACPKCECKTTYAYYEDDIDSDTDMERCAYCWHIFYLDDALYEDEVHSLSALLGAGGMKMVKVQNSYTINGEVVTKDFLGDGIAIYVDSDSQIAMVVNDKTGDVVASIHLDAYSGEGGGGSLHVQEGL